MLEEYKQHCAERADQGLPSLPLNIKQVTDLVELLQNSDNEELLPLLIDRVPPGVDEAAKIKAEFLADVAKDNKFCPLITSGYATKLLGTMRGGYNLQPLVDLLDYDTLAPIAAHALSHTLLIFEAFDKIVARQDKWSAQILNSWAEAEWFTSKPKLPESITVTVFKVEGETNTDDLSPASEAWSRPDIPLHAKAMLVN
ncbi:MAG: aconitate hydratase B, partial [Proteobacteria bacterium]|nr:aconitate hydratase B [Pseudomonadota bacterium]